MDNAQLRRGLLNSKCELPTICFHSNSSRIGKFHVGGHLWLHSTANVEPFVPMRRLVVVAVVVMMQRVC